MSDKGMDAFRTISEVADELDLPQHVLRFWETRFAQIKPMKRGGGRRYYRPVDVDLIKGIRNLLYDRGYTIKGAQRLIKDNGVAFVQALGAGDMEAARAIADKRQQDAAPTAAPQSRAAALPDNEIIVGKPKPPVSRRFFGMGGGEAASASDSPDSIGKDNRALLQETLFDLLECKRLLDQAR
ncbi:MAG: MerR family transcriptional regulator [Rhizobiaceae bacterium]|nr:MerR family transcriptional regulator [Rhizobiaceae bacterium]